MLLVCGYLLQKYRTVYIKAKSSEDKEHDLSELRYKILALDPLDKDFWRKSEGYRVGWNDEILGFECGGLGYRFVKAGNVESWNTNETNGDVFGDIDKEFVGKESGGGGEEEWENHLDLHAVLWLESYLVKWPKTFIVVSHAREFLNLVVTDILHLHGQKLTSYKGDYDTFERTREEQLKNQQKALESSEQKKAHMQAFIEKFRYNAKRASLVQSRIKVSTFMLGMSEQDLQQLAIDFGQQSYQGKQLHHLLYKTKAKEIQDFSHWES
ncbi:hypothetical protein IFM89_023222 [Coptis chinensis]|uniref:ABC-transporter extension domain-containing protein n=1 Tax=Coptis chinensis TaxID=261450 RepID=A0A835I6H1_9MAGN|nr:hypothetical protein IFM89_023222 [Coptis chinensis]